MAKLLLVSFVVCFVFVQSGYGLKCYSCDSSKVKACADPPALKDIPLTECSTAASPPGTQASCMKLATEDKSNGAEIITRKCMLHIPSVDVCKAQENKHTSDKNFKSCEVCTEDACNSVGRFDASVYMLVSLVFATLFNKFVLA